MTTILLSVFIYVYLTILLRAFGKKEFSQLNVFDFVVFLIVSELMVMAFDDLDVTMIDSVLSTLTFIVLDRLVSLMTLHSKKIRDFLEGRPSYIVVGGKLQYETMKKLRYSIDDLCHQLRVSDIDSLSKVEFAILETNGSLSVIEKKQSQTHLPDALIADGSINEEALVLLQKDRQWLEDEMKKQHKKIENIVYCIYELDGFFIIEK